MRNLVLEAEPRCFPSQVRSPAHYLQSYTDRQRTSTTVQRGSWREHRTLQHVRQPIHPNSAQARAVLSMIAANPQRLDSWRLAAPRGHQNPQ